MTLQYFYTAPAYQQGELDPRGIPVKKPGDPLWFNASAPPVIGSIVKCRINRIGDCQVTGYFVEENFLGIVADTVDPPPWFLKQNGTNRKCHLFGPEFIAQ